VSRSRRLVLVLVLAPTLAAAGRARPCPAQDPPARFLEPADEPPALEAEDPAATGDPPPSLDIDTAAPAPLDPDVLPAQQAPAAGTTPAPATGNLVVPFLGDPASLRVGKQSVGVSVQVVAPQAMTMHKTAIVTILVKNEGTADALGVVVRDQIPDGARFVKSVPEPSQVAAGERGGSVAWNLGTLPAGVEKKLTVTVEPVAKGPQDHAATVTLAAGSRAKSVVLEPVLRIEQTASKTTVLKGQQVRFDITVENQGDGPARDVVVRAELTSGLKHEQQGTVLELSLAEQGTPVLGPHKTFKLPPLYVDALGGGQQTCTVKVTSPDVAGEGPAAQSVATVNVTEPVLKLALTGSKQRPTESTAEYTITLVNEGTAPAQKVRVSAALVGDGRALPVEGAAWEKASRRWVWNEIPLLEPNGKPYTFPFRVRLGGVGVFQVNAEVAALGLPKEVKSLSTSVEGIADVDMQVTEELRVLDVGQKTIFRIKLRNLGTKEASDVQVSAVVSKNLKVDETAGTDEKAYLSPETNTVAFPSIPRLPAGGEMELGISAIGMAPGLASCRVSVSHKDLGNGNVLEDVANATITDSATRE
jgi:uncharacterized repeat protein (TIGR01451 family)